MPPATTNLDSIADFVAQDPGLPANIIQADIDDGVAAALLMNDVIMTAIEATGANDDGMITPDELRAVSDYIRANPNLYSDFVEGHGDDEGKLETGFHLVQGDGGAYRFQGRDFIDTVADAIYHVGFEYLDGRFRNEDGNANETVDDVAGWLNYFLNGTNWVFGTAEGETLHSGHYSFALDDAADEVFDAGGGDDKIWAGAGNDTIWGGAGNDRSGGDMGMDLMNGEEGNDSLWGGDGNDTIRGGSGEDELGGDAGADKLRGADGNDRLSGNEGDDNIRGGQGDDTAGGGAGDDVIKGDAGDDKIWGDEGSDTIKGGDGNDRAGGGTGDDYISGASGSDTLYGEAGDDQISGGSGLDTLGGGEGDDVLNGGGDADKLTGDEGKDELRGGRGDDSIYGGSGNDLILGEDGNDSLRGDDGRDKIVGGQGNDDINGGFGNDTLLGDDGNDKLYGSEGRDVMRGGAGADELIGWEEVGMEDIFVFKQNDTGVTEETMDVVLGFVSGEDKIDLRDFGGLTFVGGSAFSGNGSAEMIFHQKVLSIDVDGDALADAAIELRYVDALTLDDFLL